MRQAIKHLLFGICVIVLAPIATTLAYLLFPYFFYQSVKSKRGKKIRFEDGDAFCRLFTVGVLWAIPIASILLEVEIRLK